MRIAAALLATGLVVMDLVSGLGVAEAAGTVSSSAAPRPSALGLKRDPNHDPPAARDDSSTSSCRKLPAGKRIVKLNLKPETNLADLVAWISAITCRSFIVPSTIAAETKRVTIVSPGLITREEAYRLFLGALDSVGLTVYPAGDSLRVIEIPQAKTSPIPFCVINADAQDCAR